MSALVWFFAIFGACNTGEAQGWLSFVRDGICKGDFDAYANVIWKMRNPTDPPALKWAWPIKRKVEEPKRSNVSHLLAVHAKKYQL
jgi:hypothetical protein